jgi:hypothetical protein
MKLFRIFFILLPKRNSKDVTIPIEKPKMLRKLSRELSYYVEKDFEEIKEHDCVIEVQPCDLRHAPANQIVLKFFRKISHQNNIELTYI